MMYPEYGACVTVHPDHSAALSGAQGIIVGVPPYPHQYLVRTDEGLFILNVEDFEVTLAPSVAAYNLSTRHSADEILEAIGAIAEITEGKWAIYQAALVFEVIRLNHYAENPLVGGWESGTCSDGCDYRVETDYPTGGPRIVVIDNGTAEVTFFTPTDDDEQWGHPDLYAEADDE